MPAKSKPTPYPKLAFHATRAISLVASLIVSGIVGCFCYQLKHDDFKLPWTFLFIIAASCFTVLTILLTTTIYACAFLSPVFNLVLNIPIALIWIVGFSLLTWNTYGTLTHSCTKENWAVEDGMMVCRCYKANYSFVIIGLISHIAMVIVDIRARRNQTTLGKYEQMDKAADLKKESDAAWAASHDRHESYHDVPYGVDLDNRRPKSVTNRQTSPYGDNQDEYSMRDFGSQAPAQQHTYDSGNYYTGYQNGYQR